MPLEEMDEVLFLASERLDSLQTQFVAAFQTIQNIALGYSGQLQDAATEVIKSPSALRFQDGLHQLSKLIQKLPSELRRIIDYEYLRAQFFQAFGTNVTRIHVVCGCVGFIIGGAVGLTVGLSWQRIPTPFQRMKAVVCCTYGGIDSLQVLDDLPVPSLRKPDDILIQVKAASVDPIDALICSGYGRVLRKQLSKYDLNLRGEFPVVLGRDCCGVISEVGSNVSRFDIGDEVWFTVPPWLPGTLAEYVIVNESLVAKKPKGIRFEIAASVPYSGTMAWNAVVVQAGLSAKTGAGKRVLVHTGCSTVGVIIMQLAHLWGAHVTVTCPLRAIPVAQALGADYIVVCDQQPDAVKQLLELGRFDVVFNTMGHIAHEMCLTFCKNEGIVVTTIDGPIPSDKYGLFRGFLYSLWIRILCLLRRCVGAKTWGLRDMDPVILDHLGTLVENGSLQPVVDKIFSPQDAELAFQHVDSFDAIGKTVIRFRSPYMTHNVRPPRRKRPGRRVKLETSHFVN